MIVAALGELSVSLCAYMCLNFTQSGFMENVNGMTEINPTVSQSCAEWISHGGLQVLDRLTHHA